MLNDQTGFKGFVKKIKKKKLVNKKIGRKKLGEKNWPNKLFNVQENFWAKKMFKKSFR